MSRLKEFLARLRRRPGRPDPEALFADLSLAHTGRAYSDLERYQDFRAVFLSDRRGKRVLYEILTWARVFRPAYMPGDAHGTHYNDGMRNVGLKVLAVINAEPADAADETETEDPTEE